jgi:hypothetical protein
VRKKSPDWFAFLFNLALDVVLYDQLEYVFSDMNAYLPHLLKYLAAKLISAANRCQNVCLDDVWLSMLSQFGMAVDKSVMSVGQMVIGEMEKMEAKDWLILREWFQDKGRNVVH